MKPGKLAVPAALLSSLALGLPVAAQETAAPTEQAAPGDIRAELEQLKRINAQLMRRVQLLENRVGANPPPRRPAPQASPPQPETPQDRTAQPSPPQPETPQDRTAQAAVPGDTARKSPGASRGVEDLLLEEHTLFDQKFSVELGFEFAHFDRSQLILNGFLALDAIFLGDISIDEIDSDILTTSLTGRWTVTDRLQLNLTLPFVYRETTTRSGGQELSSILSTEKKVDDSDLGDISLGVSYRLFPETPTRPDIVWNTSVIAPTGREPYGIDFLEDPLNTNLQFPEELPTGSGLWGVQTGLSLLKTVDPAILFASISWRHYFEDDFNDLGSNPEALPSPGEVQLGDQYQFSLGIAFALNERTSLSTSFTQRFIDKTEITRPGFGSQTVVGSDTTTGTFDMGVTYAMTDRLSLVTNLGMGLTNDASDYAFTLKFPYRF
ncbi:MAG: transporter [Porticoccaceae bacterium]